MTSEQMEEIKDMMEATVEHFGDVIDEKLEKILKPIEELLEMVLEKLIFDDESKGRIDKWT